MDDRKAAFRIWVYAKPAVLCLLAYLSFATKTHGKPNTDGLKIHWSRSTGLASFVAAADGGPIRVDVTATASPTKPFAFLRLYGELFGLDEPDRQLVVESSLRDSLGYTHTTYQQVHKHVPVFSGKLKVHQDGLGRIVVVNGDIYPIPPDLDSVPAIDSDAAVAIAAAELASPTVTVELSELVFVDPGWYGDPPLGVNLAYHLILADPSEAFHEAFFIDAHSERVLDRWRLDYYARDRRVYDGLGTYGLPGDLARTEGEDPVGDPEDVDRAYDYLGDTYDFFYRMFGRDSLDDRGTPLTATVNSTALGCPNAAWLARSGHCVFCPGIVLDDVVAHELAHGVTFFTAGLVYQNQPGQLNESFSDVFGELVDLLNGDVLTIGPPSGPPWPPHSTGPGMDTPNLRRTNCSRAPENADGVRWLMGEDAVSYGGAFRDMWEPTCFGMPDRAYSEYQLCEHYDNGGVHTGSSIPNHAFAILVDGKEFNGYHVWGIGAIKAAAVWYRALTVYMTVAFDFEDAYVAFNQAAQDLVGTFPTDPRTGLPSEYMFIERDARQVDLALRAVEMDTPGRCGWVRHILDSGPPPECAAATSIFADDFENGTAAWTTLNSGPPTSYHWVQTATRLPYERSGTAWYCSDPHTGDCAAQDETGMHSLISPPIMLSSSHPGRPMLAFTHHIATEEGIDGGNIRISVNDGSWRFVPGSAFKFNPYNSIIKSESYGNTSPLQGMEGWTGAGGKWGTSVVDIGSFASLGDTIRIRFDFGKDGCNGGDGWYIDDFEVYVCPDCNRNNAPDSADFRFTITSPPLGAIGVGQPQQFTISSPPEARDSVTISLAAVADLGSRYEELALDINGVPVGNAFTSAARDCPRIADTMTWIVSADKFNDAVAGGHAVIGVTASYDVDPTLCSNEAFFRIFVEIPAVVADEDDNGIPDECENCSVASAPTSEPNSHERNRYISFVPANSQRQTAVRIDFTDLPHSFHDHEGTAMWVDQPFKATYPLGEERPGWYARLTCEPVFMDWSQYDIVYISDRDIIPDGVYSLQAIDLACCQPGLWEPTVASETLRYLSDALVIPTVKSWGHVNGYSGQTPPGDTVTALDVAAVVDSVKLRPGALGLAEADLQPNVPDHKVDVLDVATVVDALLGGEYPYDGPRRCP